MLAIIGGSGLTKLPELEITERKIVRTPYGLTSSPILFGRLGRLDIVFLARHGFSHTIAPHEINYRANIWALHSLGVENIISDGMISYKPFNNCRIFVIAIKVCSLQPSVSTPLSKQSMLLTLQKWA